MHSLSSKFGSTASRDHNCQVEVGEHLVKLSRQPRRQSQSRSRKGMAPVNDKGPIKRTWLSSEPELALQSHQNQCPVPQVELTHLATMTKMHQVLKKIMKSLDIKMRKLCSQLSPRRRLAACETLTLFLLVSLIRKGRSFGSVGCASEY